MPIKSNLLIICIFAISTILSPLSAQETNSQGSDSQNNHWKIAINGGIGYRISSTKDSKQIFIQQGFEESQVDGYFNGIKWGPKASAQVHYLLKNGYGIGIDYQFHTSSGSMTGIIDPGDGVTLYYGEVTDNVFTNYIGFSLYENMWIKPNKWNFYAQSSVGITFFRQENITFYTPILITGKALGVNLEAGLEYFINKNVAAGLNLNCFFSTISKATFDDGSSNMEVKFEKEQREGLSRLDSAAGLKFYF